MAKTPRASQSHGRNSKVYVPIIRDIFKQNYVPGALAVDFTLDDIRMSAQRLNLESRNPADVVYRMRSRTKLPAEILELGFYILRQTGRGKYRLEKATSTIFEIPDHRVHNSIDRTPLPVRRLLPESLAQIDEQGLLTVINYNKLLDHFTGLQVFRLRSHVRKSVATIGQAELDEIEVGVALRDDEQPVLFPVEAKAADEAVNRVQIIAMIEFCRQYFPRLAVRPLAIKLDYNSVIHILEFSTEGSYSDLEIIRSAGYTLELSSQQLELIRKTRIRLKP